MQSINSTAKLIVESINDVTKEMNMNEDMRTKLHEILILNMNDESMKSYGDVEYQGSTVNAVKFDIFGLDQLDEADKEITVRFIVARQIKEFYEIEMYGFYKGLNNKN